MKHITLAGTVLIISGILLLITGGFQGAFFVIFPFIMTSSPLASLGILLLMIGTILLFFGMATEMIGYEAIHDEEETQIEKRTLGFVMVGPVPLLIDTKNRKLTVISLVIFIIGLALLLMLIFL